jgi:quinolinate synthase
MTGPTETPARTLIASHHYQRPEIVARAALLGDSYKLAVEAARSDAEYIVVCGVRFMAESAAILAKDGQKILIPDYDAGCPMADMIDRHSAETALRLLRETAEKEVVPVTYMNSWADLKSLTGEEGGSICTSSNAKKIVSHFLGPGKAVFFLPDFNLGMNTALSLGLAADEIWTVRRDGTLSGTGDPKKAGMFLWDGFCHVHKVFTVSDIETVRRSLPGVTVMVHPECTPDVVALSDASGSTEAIYRALKNADAGSVWAIGTEGRFVERMIAEFPDKSIHHLRFSYCHNMNRIDLHNLDSTLEAIARHERTGEKLPVITVPPREKNYAKIALDTMVRITEAP